MVESLIRKRIVYIMILFTTSVNIYIYVSEIQRGILPKFISASYKDNLKLDFNSILVNRILKIYPKFFNVNSMTKSFLIGDLPIYSSPEMNTSFAYFEKLIQEEEQLKKQMKKNLNYTQRIPINDSTKYFIFPNYNKSKINIILFSLNKIENINNNTEDIIFPKLSSVSLYDIPIHNFIINYQSEFDLKKSFFEKKWEINLPGIIDKYSFSNNCIYKNTQGLLINIASLMIMNNWLLCIKISQI